MSHKKIFIVLLTGFLLGFSSAASAAPLQIFVSILPQKWLVEQVGGDLVSTRVLVDRGQEPHNFEPTPKQIAALFRSTIYFTVDMAFERAITRKIEQSGTTLQLVDVTAGIQKIPITGQAESADKNPKTAEQRQAGLDPHVWLAPDNLKIMAESVAAALAAADPLNRTEYEHNLEAVSATLDRLNTRNQQLLAPYRGATFFVFHPAFGYFARAYGLHQEAVEVAGKSPSPRQLRSLISRARAENVRVMFVQPQFDPRSARAIAHAIGGEVVPLDPLAEDVIANLSVMADKIQSALKQQ